MKASKSILLIEDDKDDQEFFREALKKIENVTLCDVASNGQEALAHLQDFSTLPDFIFSDINMPVMDGIECLAELKLNPRTKDIPVIILSSSTAHSVMVCSLGAKAFVKKPDNFNLLCAEIQNIIDDEYSLSVTIS